MNNFGDCLSMSHAAEDLPFWEEVYKKAFPTMQNMLNHRKDGDHQRQGIDRSIILENSKQILIDEKVRGRNKKTGKIYTDISLEYLSDKDRRVPGWVCKPLLCDYIAYAIAPLGKCYLLPVVQLQNAWRSNAGEWIEIYPKVAAFNRFKGREWTTLSVGVPVKELFRKMAISQFLVFDGFELEE